MSTAVTASTAEGPAAAGAAAGTKRRFKKRTGTTRERTGCLTCRQRRKKCTDNTYPVCGHCRRLNLECVREKPRSIFIPGVSDATIADDADFEVHNIYTSASSSTPPLAGPALPTPSLPTVPLASPLPTPSALAIPGSGSISIPSAMPIALPGDSHLANPSDRRYLLKYYTSVLSTLVTTNHENNSFLSVFLPMAMESSALLSSLVAWSSAHLSCNDPRLTGRTIENLNGALREVARALGGGGNAHGPHTGATLEEQECSLAASLVLCSTEVISGDTRNWAKHLAGAAGIITCARRPSSAYPRYPDPRFGTAVDGAPMMPYPSAGSRDEETGPAALLKTLDGAWLLRNFAYHDVLGSVTLGRPPMIRGVYWMREGEEVVDAYVGVGSHVLAFISHISCLEVPKPRISGVEGDGGADGTAQERSRFERRMASLERGLRGWQCPKEAPPGLVPLAEAYRGSAIVHLLRQRRAYARAWLGHPSAPHLSRRASSSSSGSASPPSRSPPSQTPAAAPSLADIDRQIAAECTAILTLLSAIPTSSLPESGILFPLFIAGGDTRSGGEVRFVRQRLFEMERCRGFKNIALAKEVLEEVWRRRGVGLGVGEGEGEGSHGVGGGDGGDDEVQLEVGMHFDLGRDLNAEADLAMSGMGGCDAESGNRHEAQAQMDAEPADWRGTDWMDVLKERGWLLMLS